MLASDAFNLAKAKIKRDVRLKNMLIGGASILGLILLWTAGVGFLGSLGILLILVIAIVFGSLGKLASSLIIAFLSVTFSAEIQEFVLIFVSGDKINAVFDFINKTGVAKLTMIIFAITYSLSYFTSCIHLFNITTTSKIENNTGR